MVLPGLMEGLLVMVVRLLPERLTSLLMRPSPAAHHKLLPRAPLIEGLRGDVTVASGRRGCRRVEEGGVDDEVARCRASVVVQVDVDVLLLRVDVVDVLLLGLEMMLRKLGAVNHGMTVRQRWRLLLGVLLLVLGGHHHDDRLLWVVRLLHRLCREATLHQKLLGFDLRQLLHRLRLR